MRTETVIFLVALVVTVAASVGVGFYLGYDAGTDDTANRWMAITDRCIAKARSLEIIARNP